MSNAAGVRSGKAYVEIGAVLDPLKKGLDEAAKRLEKWGKSVTSIGKKIAAVGTSGVGAIFGAASVFGSAGDAIQKMAIRTGLAVEALSELQFAADLSGTSLEDIETGIKRMQVALASGSEEARQALEGLGLTFESLKELSPEDQFTVIGDAISQLGDQAAKTNAMVKLFGRSGTQLAPLFSQGARGLSELRQRARELNLTMTREEADAAAAFKDAWSEVWMVLKRVTTAIGGAAAPALTKLANILSSTISPAVTFVKAHQEMFLALLKLSAYATAAGAAIIAFGYAMRATATMLSGISLGLTVAKAAIGVIVPLVSALVSPIGLVVAGLAAVTAAAIYFTGAWKPVLEWFNRSMAFTRQVFGEAWQGIVDAIQAGDLDLAFKIAVGGIKVLWAESIAWMYDKWASFKQAMLDLWYNVVYGLAALMLVGVNKVQSIWASLQTTFQTLWSRTISFLGSAWDSFYFSVRKTYIQITHLFSTAHEEAEALYKLEQERYAQSQKRAQELQDKLAAISKAGAARQADLAQQRKAMLDALFDERRRIGEEQKAAIRQRMDEMRRRADEARKVFDAARKEAEEKRKQRELNREKSPEPPKLPKVPGVPEIKQEVESRVKFSTAGSFSALALRGLSLGGPLEKIAKSTEATANNTKQLIRVVQDDFERFD
jgi:phage-related minor tail protein